MRSVEDHLNVVQSAIVACESILWRFLKLRYEHRVQRTGDFSLIINSGKRVRYSSLTKFYFRTGESICLSSTLVTELKRRSTASARLSVYANWSQTHRQTPQTGKTVWPWEWTQTDKRTDRRTDGQTDATNCIISLASRSIMRELGFLMSSLLKSVSSIDELFDL